MNWFHSGSTQKSAGEVNRLVKEVISNAEFQPVDLADFSVHKSNKTLDQAYLASSSQTGRTPFSSDDWHEISVDIEIPVPSKNTPPKVFSVSGLHHRSIVGVIKATWESISSKHFHLSPFKRIHINPSTGMEIRIYDEVYTSDAWIEAHDKLQQQPNIPGCKLEKVIAGLMFWSDSTHLTNFGTASVWPLYMYFANLSKYIRAKSNSGACHHVAYIPYLSDRLSDVLMSFLHYSTQRKPLLTHCKRELLHQVWRLLLDEEFLDAYQSGIVLQCADGISWRVYPRIFTYSADYPEKAILATIRERGLCPCPRCMVEKKKIDKMGQKNDIKARDKNPRTFMANLVQKARNCFYQLGYSIASKIVDATLKPFSLMSTMNAFVDKLSPLGFNLYPIFVVDLMHEFELGVWKATFIHILRILNAASPGSRLLAELNNR
ncbi:hypothetical protein BDZ94DRAFT_1179515 [Collybia nuda]|uniref:Transposase n=1 Tax=Collybia nuda TaxID=64659 RepID=A0A9P5XTY6_9AGAR|nr:hypothetical protein BDZ94DRAFT_1179515 [Collybia nuda]